jgi:MoaA/NifB/PqqE/SkfB family radical SAM enzyme
MTTAVKQSGPRSARAAGAAFYPALHRAAERVKSIIGTKSARDTAAPPVRVVLELTPAGPLAEGGAAEVARAGPAVDWARIIDAAPSRARIVLAGEPLASPDLEEALFEADRRNMRVTVETSGARLEECAPMMYGLDVASVALTIHGTEDVHNRMAGSSRAFEEAARGALAMKMLNEGSGRPALVIVVSVSTANHARLVQAVECAFAMGADRVVVKHARPGFACEGALTLPERLGGEFTSPWRERLSIEALLREVKHVKARWPRGGVLFSPDMHDAQLRSYYTLRPERLVSRRCDVPWRELTVGGDGTARLCGLGAIGEGGERLSEAFNCAEALRLRRELRRQQTSVCAACRRRFGDGNEIDA